MSLESAMKVLDQAAAKQASGLETKPGTDPSTAEVVKDKVADATKDVQFDLKSDSLKTETPKEETKAEAKEVKPETKTEEKPTDDTKMSERFALLARKEKDLYKNAQSVKAREAELESRWKAIQDFEKLKQEAPTNPILALQMLKSIGITYDDITKAVVSGKVPSGASSEIEDLRAMVKEVKETLKQKEEKEKQDAAEAKRKADQEKIAAFQQNIRDYLTTNADKYELINLNDASHRVYERIAEEFEKTERIMPFDEASDLVEKELEDILDKNLRARKLAARTKPVSAPAEAKQALIAQQRTLTNELTSSAPSMLPAKTEADRMKRAMAALTRN